MKQLVTLVVVVAVGLLACFLRWSCDETVIDAKTAENAALHETVESKDKLLAQINGSITDRDEEIKGLQAKIKSDQDLLATDEVQSATDKAAYEKLQNADQTIINSLKGDNQADIAALKSQIQDKDDQIAQLNERLAQTIADYETKLNAARSQMASAPGNGETIYPKDNGFELQDVGTGFFSYRYLSDSPPRNPTNVEMPPAVANQTPWTFYRDAGVVANNSGYYLTNASNGDSDGKTSPLGQAAFLQFKDSGFSQVINLPAGTFSVTFGYEARRDYTPNEIAVSLDGHTVFTGGPLATDHFVEVTTDPIKLPAGKHKLLFMALGDGNDDSFPCTFIDNVRLNIVNPEKHRAKKAADGTASALDGSGE